MFVSSNIKNKYTSIQKQLYYMIPEKWESVHLYASVLEHYSNVQTGEMFFYYIPKSVIKKNPVNVYEIPKKFNIDEKGYLSLAENLYKEIKELRKAQIEDGERPWTNVTITIKDFKFVAEYSYTNLMQSEYNAEDRHLIWRYKNLNIPLEMNTKKEQKMILKFLKNEKEIESEIITYSEGVYKAPSKNLLEYKEIQEKLRDKQSYDSYKPQKDSKEKVVEKRNQILNI